LAKRIRKHLGAYKPHKAIADVRHLRWFADAAQAYRTKKGGRKNLEQLLGLKRAPGRPGGRKSGKHFDLAHEIFRLRSTASPTRKSRKGKLTPLPWKENGTAFKSEKSRRTPTPWKEIGPAVGMSPRAALKLYERYLPDIVAAIAGEIVARLKRRSSPNKRAKREALLNGQRQVQQIRQQYIDSLNTPEEQQCYRAYVEAIYELRRRERLDGPLK
jgi:hypothetical protein